MSTIPYNIIAGPANVWTAAIGVSPPAVDAAPNGSWSSLGRTDGGVKVSHDQTVKNLNVDQTILIVKVIRTEVQMKITFKLAEITLETYTQTLNAVALTTVAQGVGIAGNKSFAMSMTVDMPFYAMLVRGPSPYMNAPFGLQYELAKVVQSGKPELDFTRTDKSVLATEWMAMEDPSNLGQFGILRAQTTVAG